MLLDDNYDTNKVNWREERVGSQNTVFGMSCETEWYHKHSRLSFTIGPKVSFHRNACKRNTIRESEIPRALTKIVGNRFTYSIDKIVNSFLPVDNGSN
jgi:hypothetical protein